MSLLDYLVDYCDERYRSHIDNGYPCEHCDQPRRCSSHHPTERDCKQCCDDIHFHRTGGRIDYDCDHLFDYYVCRYSYKYCSEILYAYNLIDESEYPFLNILSLGCGPSPDLMAFDNEYIGAWTNKPINYIGIDINEGWSRIHKKIMKYYKNIDGVAVDYKYDDVIDILCGNNPIPDCNILVIEYLISHLINTGQFELLDNFFDGIVKNIVWHRNPESPFLIIISDADSINTGRDRFWDLNEKIRNAGLNTNTIAKCFSPTVNFPGASRYANNRGKFIIPQEIMEKYKGAYYCNGAQLIIEVR